MKKMIRKIEVRIRYIIYALKTIGNPHLMEKVTYKGEKCSLIQGVNNPYWDLLPLSPENLAKDHRYIYHNIHISEFKLQPFIKRFWFVFKSSYRFAMGYWYSIDIQRNGKCMFCN